MNNFNLPKKREAIILILVLSIFLFMVSNSLNFGMFSEKLEKFLKKNTFLNDR